jgi:tRNA pseudouridine38-40 synthase
MSRTYLALLHYDGRAFVGWQRQPEGRSVQAEIEGVLERLCGRRTVVHGAGRTDAGVHSMGLGVSFSVAPKWSAESLRRALNALLPRDCWVQQVHPMQPGFHARKSATGRRYRYVVGTDPGAMSPFRRPYEWALGRDLDPWLLIAAASLLPGRHDFRAFAVRRVEGAEGRKGGKAVTRTGGQVGGRSRGQTVSMPLGPSECTIRLAEWQPRDENRGFSFHIAADRFLHHMVRFLVGTMVDIGLGRRPLDDMARLLVAADNQATSPPAPPQGLFFLAAEYGEEWYLQADGRAGGQADSEGTASPAEGLDFMESRG